MVDERISRAIDNDHTAAMKITSDGRKLVRKKNGSTFTASGNLFVCTICKKLFKNHLIYRRHLKIHSEKSFVCQVCNKSFVHKHYLLSHMLSHSKNQHYQCHLCHKRFSQKGNLNQHLKFHTTKKPFKCEECKKDFHQQEHLKAHMRQHTNERPYQCEICSKTFNIKSSLQRHMNCHTGAKPFICDICNRGYTRRSVLMLHIQQVHENKKPYQCSECQMCFSQKGNLQAHFRRKHLQPKSESKRGKDRDKNKRGVRKQSYRQNSKLMRKSPAKVISNLPDIYGRNNKAVKEEPEVDRVIQTSEFVRESSEVFNGLKMDPIGLDFRIDPNDQDMVPDSCISSLSSEEANSLALRIENGELYKFLNSNDDILGNADSECLPTFHNSYPFSSDSLQEDSRVLSEFDMLLTDAKGWEDYLLADPELLEPSTTSDILSTPSKVSSGLNKTGSDGREELFPNLLPPCHDYACPPPQSMVVEDIPLSCSSSKSILPRKLAEKKSVVKPVHTKKKNVVLIGEPQPTSTALSLFKQHKVHLPTGTTVLA